MSSNISYTNLCSILLKEINKARNDPHYLLPFLQQRLLKYDREGRYFPLTSLNFSILTVQGSKGVQHLIDFLQDQRKCSSFQWSYELHKAADKKSRLLASGNVSQQKMEEMEMGKIVEEFADWKGHLAELTFYGFVDPKEFICEMLIEDGKSDKRNRDEFYNHRSNFIGIGVSTHSEYKFVIVLMLAMHAEPKSHRRPLQKEFMVEENPSSFCSEHCEIW